MGVNPANRLVFRHIHLHICLYGDKTGRASGINIVINPIADYFCTDIIGGISKRHASPRANYRGRDIRTGRWVADMGVCWKPHIYRAYVRFGRRSLRGY